MLTNRTRRRAWRVAGLTLAIAASLALSREASADDVADEADHLFELGTEHYRDGAVKEALSEFLASNRLVKNRNVIYNIARCYERLGRIPDAFRYYERALEGETDPKTIERLRAEQKRLAARVAVLKIETSPPGALVYVDRKDLGDRGRAPETLGLAPGSVTVIASLDGYADATSGPIALSAGTERTVHLALRRIVGAVELTSPLGARAYLEDDPAQACTLPCKLSAPPGRHIVVLSRANFRTRRVPVEIAADTTTSLAGSLEPETGSIVVHADERGAAITIDGRTEGFTPAVLDVPLGRHVVEVSLAGYRPVQKAIDVRADVQTRVDVALAPADFVEAASRSAESVANAPASVTLLPTQELRGMRYPTVAAALRGVRGVFVSDDRGYKSAGFRGFGRPGDYGNRVLVLLDGQPTNDNWLWSSYIGYDLRTDLDDIERIEVVRGPGSLLYGTGAFSGVINLVTNYEHAPDGRELGVSVAQEGVARARARLTHHFTKDSGVWTSIAGGRSTGLDLFVPEFAALGPPTYGTARGVDGFKVGTLQGRVWWKSFTVQWFANHHDKQLPAGQFETTFGDPRTHQADTRAFVEAKFTPNVARDLTWLSRVHGNYYGYDGVFARAPDDGGLEHDTYRGAWAGLEQRFVHTPTRAVKLTFGGEVQYHALAHQRSAFETDSAGFDDKRDFTLGAAYGNVDVEPSRAIKITGGARFDAYSTFGSSLNPRAAVIIKPSANDNIKLLSGKAFRAPSVYELYNVSGGGQRAAGHLDPENMYSGEVEYSHQFSRTVIGTMSVYANYIERLIALADLPGATASNPAYAYQNTGVPVGTLGGELELRREWKDGWMVSASYSLQKSRYLASDSFAGLFAFDRAPNMREVPNAPNQLASIKGAAPILDRALLLTSRLTFDGPRFDRNDKDGPGLPAQGKTASALLWDIVLSGAEPRTGLSYAVGVYNAFDTQWSVPVSKEFRQTTVAQLGRTFLATCGLAF